MARRRRRRRPRGGRDGAVRRRRRLCPIVRSVPVLLLLRRPPPPPVQHGADPRGRRWQCGCGCVRRRRRLGSRRRRSHLPVLVICAHLRRSRRRGAQRSVVDGHGHGRARRRASPNRLRPDGGDLLPLLLQLRRLRRQRHGDGDHHHPEERRRLWFAEAGTPAAVAVAGIRAARVLQEAARQQQGDTELSCQEPAGEDQRAAEGAAGAGAERREGGHGDHAGQGHQLRQVHADAAQGAGDRRVLAGVRRRHAGHLPGQGRARRHHPLLVLALAKGFSSSVGLANISTSFRSPKIQITLTCNSGCCIDFVRHACIISRLCYVINYCITSC
uniref:Uncharacterized protein n=1 Tax=Oryza barthii TaxID=65489 RepID=A0A0D3GH07_9ORYZ